MYLIEQVRIPGDQRMQFCEKLYKHSGLKIYPVRPEILIFLV